MRKKALAEELISLIIDQPGVTLMRKERSPCGRCKRRVKITQVAATQAVLGVTEPDQPRYDLHIEASNINTTKAWMHSYLHKQGIEVFYAK